MKKRVLFNRIINEGRNLVLSKVSFLQLGKSFKVKQFYLVLVLITVSVGSFLGFSTILTGSLFQPERTIPSSGQITTVGVGVYWDENSTNRVSSLDWGTLEPYYNKNITVYIRNEGNTAASLAMNSTNWNPSSAISYMTLAWNYSGQRIDADKSIRVAFTLSISGDIQGITSFSFDIVVRGRS